MSVREQVHSCVSSQGPLLEGLSSFFFSPSSFPIRLFLCNSDSTTFSPLCHSSFYPFSPNIISHLCRWCFFSSSSFLFHVLAVFCHFLHLPFLFLSHFVYFFFHDIRSPVITFIITLPISLCLYLCVMWPCFHSSSLEERQFHQQLN